MHSNTLAPTWAHDGHWQTIDRSRAALDRAATRGTRRRRGALAARGRGATDLAPARHGVRARLHGAGAGLLSARRAGTIARRARARRSARARRCAVTRRARVLGDPRADARRDAGDRVGVARRGARQEPARDRRARRRPPTGRSPRRARRSRRPHARRPARARAGAYAVWRAARAALEAEHGAHLDDDAFVATLAHAALASSPERARAKYQIAMTVCERCRQGWQHGAGAKIAVRAAAVEVERPRAHVDARHDATRALTQLGWKPAVARPAVEAATRELGPSAPLERILFEALRRCS